MTINIYRHPTRSRLNLTGSELDEMLFFPYPMCSPLSILLLPLFIHGYQHKMDPLHRTSKMHMRDATLRDIPRLVEIWITAFLADSSYDAVYPWRHERPDDFQRLYAKNITTAFLQGSQRYLVVETDVVNGNGRSETEIVGWTSWTRNGSSQAAQKIRANNKTVVKGKSIPHNL